MLRHILLGMKDYLKDVYHDRLVRDAKELGCKVQDSYIRYNSKNNKTSKYYIDAVTWKEGSMFHYIRQRHLTAKYTKNTFVLLNDGRDSRGNCKNKCVKNKGVK